METILLSTEEKEKKEEGLRLLILYGVVEYTGRKDVYRVSHDALRRLDESKIPYHVLSER